MRVADAAARTDLFNQLDCYVAEMTQQKLSRILIAAAAILLLLAALAFVVPRLEDGPVSIWEILTVVGTVGATVVALVLAYAASRRDRDGVARLVSAWVTDELVPLKEIPAYRRVVQVHVGNESNEPVFDVRVSVLLGEARTPVGPLSAPTMIVLPPRREIAFDISIPLLAHEVTWHPRVKMYFTDPSRRRWRRDGEGRLEPAKIETVRWSETSVTPDAAQLGDLESTANPIAIAMAFLEALREYDGRNDANLLNLIADEAVGWRGVVWADVRDDTINYQPTSMVDYPASHIARVKLAGDQTLQGRTVVNEGGVLADVMYMTLTFNPTRGWFVYGLGNAVQPHQIILPEGAFE